MIVFIFYHFIVLLFGYWIYNQVFTEKKSMVFVGVFSIVTGLLASLPLTYLIATIFGSSKFQIESSMFIFGLIISLLLWIDRKKMFTLINTVYQRKESNFIDIIVILFSSGISWYIMSKTFKVATDGTLLVARNSVFDFGHGLSIIRSMSWGNNIPFTSPFVAGTLDIYHFIFNFWISVFEYVGFPLNLAVNIPSTISFSLLLLTIYLFGKEFFGKAIVGVLGIMLTVFHGGLMFIPFFQKYGISLNEILRNPNYLLSDTVEGPLSSIYFTLNVFVNQRHLAISLSMFLILFLVFTNGFSNQRDISKRLYVYSFFIGLFSLWHIILTFGLVLSIVCGFLLHNKWKKAVVFIVFSSISCLIFVSPWLGSFIRAGFSMYYGEGLNITESVSSNSSIFSQLLFIIVNLGISLPFFIIGIIHDKKIFKLFIPLYIIFGIVMFASENTGISHQKFLNIFLMLIYLFSAVGIYTVYNYSILMKALTVFLFPFIILSGVIDFMVIKNDYLFPVPHTQDNDLVSWIDKNTEKNAVFISYQEMFDPVTLAGRKNYYGFFKQPSILLAESDKERDKKVANLLNSQDDHSLRESINAIKADYILLPVTPKSDFSFTVNYALMKHTFPVLLEDFDHILLKIK